MKIGIVGPADRAVAWETHLRHHQSVSEVEIAAKLREIGKVDACLIIDDSDQNLQHLLKAIQVGYHSFLIAPLPTDNEMVEKVYHAAEEANVHLQFAHWPTLAPASQWMSQRIRKPTFLQVIREINHTKFMEMGYDLDYFWIDELAFCLKWIDGAVHHIEIKKAGLPQTEDCAIHLFLRFDSGATAAVYVNTCAPEDRHNRFAADQSFLADCDVLSQTVRLGKNTSGSSIYFEKQTFDPSQTAEKAVTLFIKAIQLNKRTPFNGYDAWQLCLTIDKIKKRMVRI